MGYDALFIPDVDDAGPLRVSKEQCRTLLTRDRYIVHRRVVRTGRMKVLLLESDDFREQMRQVTEALSLGFHDGFSRCIESNTPLDAISKESVRKTVPLYVLNTQVHFLICSCCHKIYWRGTHWRNMKVELVESKKEA